MAKYTLNKKRPDEISERARRLNEQSITVNIHDHMMFEFAIRKALGQKNIFNTYYSTAVETRMFQCGRNYHWLKFALSKQPNG